MRQHSFSGLGGQAVLSPGKGLFRCKGARPGARWARLFLRKPDRISGWISFPADAFSAQRPPFRATSLLFRKKERTKVKGGKLTMYIAKGLLLGYLQRGSLLAHVPLRNPADSGRRRLLPAGFCPAAAGT